MYMIPYPCFNYSPIGIAKESWLPVGLQSAHAPWKAPFVPWGRHSPHWATKTPGCYPLESWTCISPDNSPLTINKTHRQHGSNPSHSQS
jgi:hypothetical protein